jgi:tRNA-dihydrouridine synthase B
LDWNGPLWGLREMRGRYGQYLKGLPGIRDWLRSLVQLPDAGSVKEVLQEIALTYRGFEIPAAPIRLVDYHANCTL